MVISTWPPVVVAFHIRHPLICISDSRNRTADLTPAALDPPAPDALVLRKFYELLDLINVHVIEAHL